MRARLSLVHGPTPIVKRRALDVLLGVDLWIKRDDATAGAESGNKVRKLELLLADARARGADTVLTCGGIQSNHARATALACAELGLACVLFLRVEGEAPGPEVAAPREMLPCTGNVFLDRLVGAEIRLVSRADYAQRSAVMEAAAVRLAAAGRKPYVIPEGGSNGLGALGYVEAMREVKEQLALGLGGGPEPFDEVVHACGSGGTAAGVALGAARFGVAARVRAVCVCDDAGYFERVIARIIADARTYDASLGDAALLVVDVSARGPAYGVMDAQQRRFVVEVARASGLVLDPVYTGKAMWGLAKAVERGDIAGGARVLFIHTGGLPGLLAQGDAFEAEL
jgi:D-cysteine desulfhydrase family pyridoxal phosphate-dependent enzyme